MHPEVSCLAYVERIRPEILEARHLGMLGGYSYVAYARKYEFNLCLVYTFPIVFSEAGPLGDLNSRFHSTSLIFRN